jgi:hypothetical protein
MTIPLCHAQGNERMNMTANQMDLEIQTKRPGASRQSNTRPPSAAQAWFTRMHRLVDKAVPVRPALLPRPHQGWLVGAVRQIDVG